LRSFQDVPQRARWRLLDPKKDNANANDGTDRNDRHGGARGGRRAHNYLGHSPLEAGIRNPPSTVTILLVSALTGALRCAGSASQWGSPRGERSTWAAAPTRSRSWPLVVRRPRASGPWQLVEAASAGKS
jgi:hypothetical protein